MNQVGYGASGSGSDVRDANELSFSVRKSDNNRPYENMLFLPEHPAHSPSGDVHEAESDEVVPGRRDADVQREQQDGLDAFTLRNLQLLTMDSYM